jgi:2-polyprenyl-6-methoxyphenol hydroxylase-like FAD-dependent oxidoreductase
MDDGTPGARTSGRRTAIVVGGGIGGLAAAIALHRCDWHVEVLERAPAFDELGAGLSLWPNGIRALDALGLGDQVRGQALTATEGGIRDVTGRWMARTDVRALERRYGPVVAIHRAQLADILRRALPAATPRMDTEVTAVDSGGPQVAVRHTRGVSRADLLVGADGIRSVVRRSLWPDHRAPRYAGYTAWRLIIGSERPPSAGGETWGRGERVGIVPLADGTTYLFAAANAPEGQHGPRGELAEMRRRFSGWHAPIPELLAAASEEAVMRHDIYELPPLRTYVHGATALLGDAAHAMTPDLGQGANLALEDAVTLAAMLAAHPAVESALAAYDRERRARCRRIARRSRLIGTVAQWSRAPAAVRDRVLRLSPSWTMLRALEPALTWRPPDPA